MSRLTINSTVWQVVQRGSGTPILFVHGFPLDHQMWQDQLNELSEDFRVIAPDLRGFGESEVAGSTVTMAEYADDLAQLLDQLDITQPIALCGLSMGGYVAWQFWRRHTARLSHLILCDTRAAADTQEAARARLELAQKVLDQGSGVLAASMISKLFSDQTRRQRPDLISATEKIINHSPPQGAAAALRGMAQRQDATPWLSEVDVPTLVICGQEDALTSVTEMREIAAALPRAEMAVIPACGHMAPLEDPARVNQAIRRFLKVPPAQ